MIRNILIILIISLILSSDAFAQQQAANGNPGWWKGDETPPFAGGVIRDAYCDVIKYMEGSLGGLLMAAAGVLAFATAAFGNFKHGVTAMAVGISAYTMSAMVSLYFGELCGGGNGQARNTATTRVFEQQDITAPDLDFEAETEKKEDPFDL